MRDVVLRLTGVDVMVAVPPYRSERAALTLHPAGLLEAVSELLGAPAPDHQPGRPALIQTIEAEVMGVTLQHGVVVFIGSRVLSLGARHITAQWSV